MAGLVLYPDDLPMAVRCGAVSVNSPLRPSLGPRADRADISLLPTPGLFRDRAVCPAKTRAGCGRDGTVERGETGRPIGRTGGARGAVETTRKLQQKGGGPDNSVVLLEMTRKEAGRETQGQRSSGEDPLGGRASSLGLCFRLVCRRCRLAFSAAAGVHPGARFRKELFLDPEHLFLGHAVPARLFRFPRSFSLFMFAPSKKRSGSCTS